MNSLLTEAFFPTLSALLNDLPGRLPELTDAEVIQARLDAELDVLADVDTYADWLYSKCIGNQPSHTALGYIPTTEANMRRFVESLDVPQLLACTLRPHRGLPEIAAWELRTRYLADEATQRYIERKAAEKQAAALDARY